MLQGRGKKPMPEDGAGTGSARTTARCCSRWQGRWAPSPLPVITIAVPGLAGSADLAAFRRPGHAGVMHKTSGVREPAAAFPLPRVRDDAADLHRGVRPGQRDNREAGHLDPAVGCWAPGSAAARARPDRRQRRRHRSTADPDRGGCRRRPRTTVDRCASRLQHPQRTAADPRGHRSPRPVTKGDITWHG